MNNILQAGHRGFIVSTVGIVLLLLFSASAPVAFSQKHSSATVEWMLEVSRANQPPEYFELPANGFHSQIGIGELDRETGQKSADDSQSQLSSLDLDCSLAGNSARLRVALIFQTQSNNAAQSREVEIGTYIVRPDKPATLSELTGFGLKPVEVKLVTAKVPAAIMPTVTDDTKSLSVDSVDENRAGYQIFLHNTSPAAVAGVAISVRGSNDVCDLHTFRASRAPLIAPNETVELELSAPQDKPRWFGPAGESCSDAKTDVAKTDAALTSKPIGAPAIAIDAVDFEDGNYEGDPAKAAMMEAMRLGKEAERERTAAIVEPELQTAQTSDSEKISSIRTKVSGSLGPDSELVRSTMERFAFLPASASKSIEIDLQAGARDQKNLFLNNLKSYESEVSSGQVQDVSLEQWWNATKGQCDLLLPQYCDDRR